MIVELVCSDVDGTIVASKYPETIISARTSNAVECICNQGIKFVLASGRPLRTMLPVAKLLNYTGIMICLNGALVYDYKKKLKLYSISMNSSTISQLITQNMSIFGADVGFGLESGTKFLCDQKYFELRHAYIDHEYSLFDNIISMIEAVESAEKVIIIHEHLPAPELYPKLLEHFAGGEWQKKIHISLGSPHFIDISSAGVNKGMALKKLCQDMNIQAENTVAFGNMLNDFEMLGFAGTGVAVADAHPLLLDSADLITDTCSNDGVAMVLEHIIMDRCQQKS